MGEAVRAATTSKPPKTPRRFDEHIKAAMGTLYVPPGTNPVKPAAASTTAELAFTLLTFSVQAGKPITDLIGQSGRVKNDRAVSDIFVKEELAKLAIPHSNGPMQSSSLRAGYDSAHVRKPGPGSGGAVWDFITWTDTLTVKERKKVWRVLAHQFAYHTGSCNTPLPQTHTQWPWAKFEALIDHVDTYPSEGAGQQYLLAALLTQQGGKVRTKKVFAPDSTTSGGDVRVTHPNGTVTVYEVSASNWRAKLTQALNVLTEPGVGHVVVAAATTGPVTVADVQEEARKYPQFTANAEVEIVVQDWRTLCVALAVTLTEAQRTQTVETLARMLREYAPTQTQVLTNFEYGESIQ